MKSGKDKITIGESRVRMTADEIRIMPALGEVRIMTLSMVMELVV